MNNHQLPGVYTSTAIEEMPVSILEFREYLAHRIVGELNTDKLRAKAIYHCEDYIKNLVNRGYIRPPFIDVMMQDLDKMFLYNIGKGENE